MELIFLFFCLMLFPTILIAKAIQPYANGTKKIDPVKHPMLARAQRIRRYKNVTAREREQKFLAQARVKKEQQAITAIANESFDRLNASQAHHKELTDFFDKMFYEYDAPDRERKRLEAVEADRIAAAEKRAKLDEYEKRRVRELEMWTIAEKKRIADFKAEQSEIEKNARIDRAVKAKKLEEYYTAAQSLTAAGGLVAPTETSYDIDWKPVRGASYPDTGSYGDRSVIVHGVYARLRANRSANILNNFTQYDKISVDGWTVGEELYGNPIWFHQKPGNGYLAGWIWSGALNNRSTSGLQRMDDTVKLSSNESIYESLDRMKDLSGRELAALQTRIKNEFESYSSRMENPTHADVDNLNMLADAAEAVHLEQDNRERVFHARRELTQNSMNALETLEKMHANPTQYKMSQEIAELQAEIVVLDERINPKPTPKDVFGTISANMITGTTINFGNGVTMSEHGITGLHRT